MEKHIEFSQSGIKCDNPECDFRDDEVKEEDYKDWLDRPCPKCGANLLTQEDYENSLKFEAAVNFINTLSPEDLEELSKVLTLEELANLPMFKDTAGFDKLFTEERIVANIESHGGVRITSIETDDTQQKENTK